MSVYILRFKIILSFLGIALEASLFLAALPLEVLSMFHFRRSDGSDQKLFQLLF